MSFPTISDSAGSSVSTGVRVFPFVCITLVLRLFQAYVRQQEWNLGQVKFKVEKQESQLTTKISQVVQKIISSPYPIKWDDFLEVAPQSPHWPKLPSRIINSSDVISGLGLLLLNLTRELGENWSVRLHHACQTGQEFVIHAMRYAKPHLFDRYCIFLAQEFKFPRLAGILEGYVVRNEKPKMSVEMVYLYWLAYNKKLTDDLYDERPNKSSGTLFEDQGEKIEKLFYYLKSENRLGEIDLNMAAQEGPLRGKSIFYFICDSYLPQPLWIFFTLLKPFQIHAIDFSAGPSEKDTVWMRFLANYANTPVWSQLASTGPEKRMLLSFLEFRRTTSLFSLPQIWIKPQTSINNRVFQVWKKYAESIAKPEQVAYTPDNTENNPPTPKPLLDMSEVYKRFSGKKNAADLEAVVKTLTPEQVMNLDLNRQIEGIPDRLSIFSLLAWASSRGMDAPFLKILPHLTTEQMTTLELSPSVLRLLFVGTNRHLSPAVCAFLPRLNHQQLEAIFKVGPPPLSQNVSELVSQWKFLAWFDEKMEKELLQEDCKKSVLIFSKLPCHQKFFAFHKCCRSRIPIVKLPSNKPVDGLEEIIKGIEAVDSKGGEKLENFLRLHANDLHSLHINGWTPLMSAVGLQKNSIVDRLLAYPITSVPTLYNAILLARFVDNRKAAVKILSLLKEKIPEDEYYSLLFFLTQPQFPSDVWHQMLLGNVHDFPLNLPPRELEKRLVSIPQENRGDSLAFFVEKRWFEICISPNKIWVQAFAETTFSLKTVQRLLDRFVETVMARFTEVRKSRNGTWYIDVDLKSSYLALMEKYDWLKVERLSDIFFKAIKPVKFSSLYDFVTQIYAKLNESKKEVVKPLSIPPSIKPIEPSFTKPKVLLKAETKHSPIPAKAAVKTEKPAKSKKGKGQAQKKKKITTHSVSRPVDHAVAHPSAVLAVQEPLPPRPPLVIPKSDREIEYPAKELEKVQEKKKPAVRFETELKFLNKLADLGLAEQLLSLHIFEGNQPFLAIDLAMFDIISKINRECPKVKGEPNLDSILIHGAYQPLRLNSSQVHSDLLPFLKECYLNGAFDPHFLNFKAQSCPFFQNAKRCTEGAFDPSQHLVSMKTLVKLLPGLKKLYPLPEWRGMALFALSATFSLMGEQYARLKNNGAVKFPDKIENILKKYRHYRNYKHGPDSDLKPIAFESTEGKEIGLVNEGKDQADLLPGLIHSLDEDIVSLIKIYHLL